MRLVIGLVLGLAAGAAQAAGPTEPQQVTLWGRSWVVVPVDSQPNMYIAVQDDNNLNPFGRPAIRKSIQAKKAVETATGCKVIWSGMKKDIRDTFYAPVTCD